MSNTTNPKITEGWLQQNIEVDKHYTEVMEAYRELYKPEHLQETISFTLPFEINNITSQIKDSNGNSLEKTLVLTAEDEHLIYERCWANKLNNQEENELAKLLKKAVSSVISHHVYDLDNNGRYSIHDTKFRLEFKEDGTHYFKLI